MQPAQADAARALFASVLNERGLQTARRRAPARRRAARTAGQLPRSRPLLRLGLRHARPLPLGLALRGPSPVAERGAAGGRPRHRDAVLRRRASRHGARRSAHAASACSAPPRISRARSWPASPTSSARTAIIADRSFGEIVASPQRERDLGQPTRPRLLGEMDGAQRATGRGADGPLPRHAGRRPCRPRRSSA